MAYKLFCILTVQLIAAHGLYLNGISKNHETNNPENCDVVCKTIEPTKNNKICNCNSTATEPDILKIKRQIDDDDEESPKNKFKIDFSKFRMNNQNDEKPGFIERLRERFDELREARENSADQKPALVERFYEKVEQLKDMGKASEPVLGQINPSIMNFSPHNTGIGGIPPIVPPGSIPPLHNPFAPQNNHNPFNYNRYYNHFDPLHRLHPYRPDPILVAPIYRAAGPPPAKPILNALRDHVDHLISGLDKHHPHPPGLLNSDAMSNSESQVNQINVNVRLDGSSTPHTLFAHLLPILGGLSGLAAPLVSANNPDYSSDESVTLDPIGNGLTTTEKLENPLTGPANFDLVTEEPKKEIKEITKKYNNSKKKFKIIKGRLSENADVKQQNGTILSDKDVKDEIRQPIEGETRAEDTTVLSNSTNINEVIPEIVSTNAETEV